MKAYDGGTVVVITAGNVQVDIVNCAATGEPAEALALARVLAATWEYGGTVAHLHREARAAHAAGLVREARVVKVAVDLWRTALDAYAPKEVEEGTALDDHHVQRATYGLLRLGDTIPSDLRARIQINPRRWSGDDASDAIVKAICGWRRFDATTEESREAVQTNLSAARRRALRDHDLPRMEKALLRLREGVDALITDAYQQGVKDGSDLLAGLASGQVSASTFNQGRS